MSPLFKSQNTKSSIKKLALGAITCASLFSVSSVSGQQECIETGLQESMNKAKAVVQQQLEIRPNVIWFMAEDLTNLIAAYGDSTANTPNINRLADEGVTYSNCFSISGVCAPSRSALMTGCYPTSIGTHNMRVLGNNLPDPLFEYDVPIPGDVHCFTEYLRVGGYYTTNNNKED